MTSIPVKQLRGRRLGRVLIKMGDLTREQVHEALEIQTQRRGPLGRILVELGYITEDKLNMALAAQKGMEVVSLDTMEVSKEIIKLISPQMANIYNIVPIDYKPEIKTLTIAMSNPDNFQATDDIKRFLGFNTIAAYAPDEQIKKALTRYYPEEAEEDIQDLIDEIKKDSELSKLQGRGDSVDLDTLKEMAESNPVKKLLNLILFQAIRDKAADIHFEPFEEEFRIRYRIDGVLYEMESPPRHVAMALASRVKVMANLDIAERRVPQDGRIPLTLRGQPVDLRVSVLPTMFGESIVMRVLDRSQVSLDIEKLGFREDDTRLFRQLIHKPHGVIVVTGPTGSGKTTTLYSALNELNSVDVKILTAENPVEYDIQGLMQVQVNEEIGLTFARCLRAYLRQDPDIILVGEIRDLETATIAIQAALTGHLVFTTLHTNDAPSTIARLVDLGVEPFLMTATVEAIVAQRLVRKICRDCKTPFTPTEEMLLELNLTPEDVKGKQFYYGKGCEACNNTGYRGRMGIYEIMVLDDEMRDLIVNQASTQVLRQEARKRGMRTLRQAGLLALYDGSTTIEEIAKETMNEED
ncbi:MAG: Flp pilus assembly complex ATPase component TadA [Phycisphaerae bacterium]|nr:Flp pilus assembly complex ATPase component TadA [Phycisphaerae bacterium]